MRLLSRVYAGMPPAIEGGMSTDPIGPVTKFAILGVVIGVVTLPLVGVLTGQFGLGAGLAGGFVGGLVGGGAFGLGSRFASVR